MKVKKRYTLHQRESATTLKRWSDAAKQAGFKFRSAWIRDVLNKQAISTLYDKKKTNTSNT